MCWLYDEGRGGGGFEIKGENKSLSVQTWCGGRVREAKVGFGVQLGAHLVRNRND